MSRAERLLDLIQILRGYRAPVTGTVLAGRLGVSLRTLYRDIATLQAQGADIAGEPGLGYVLKPGFMLPPLMFSEDEIEALVLGARWVRARADGRLGAAAETVLAKVGAVLPPDLRTTLDDSGLVIGPGPPIVGGDIDLDPVRSAIRREHRLDIGYRDEAGRVTRRRIWPFALAFFESVRIVAAWCEMRSDFRHFRVDRISEIVPTETRYPKRRAALMRAWRKSLSAKIADKI